ncbi:hypothetical protein HYFRA_00009568 [Hymenoscyphus fraxineus]|uniref:Uncharacterized protein n=1 Tax=Hymenoscyphus fraxineus TaxID=746836 RepID=A0A9N9KY33_9HELO|nr:hypothetical protein HYFRA_00009568 [Hymenoscyphus fraxineus]
MYYMGCSTFEVSTTNFSLFKTTFFIYCPKFDSKGKFNIELYESLINIDHNPQPEPPVSVESTESLVEPAQLPAVESPVSVESTESPQMPACEPAELPGQQIDQPCPMESTPICTVSAESPVSIEAPEATTPAESPQSLGLATVATALFCTLFLNRHVPVGMELLALLFRGGGGMETTIIRRRFKDTFRLFRGILSD